MTGIPLLVLEFALIGVIWYFLIIRPQQKQRAAHEKALRELKRGDEVVTAGGIVGKVVHLKEAAVEGGAAARPMEDRVTIESGESRLVVERGRIARVNGGAAMATTTRA
jgi:preprotein translocase subunit YajC